MGGGGCRCRALRCVSMREMASEAVHDECGVECGVGVTMCVDAERDDASICVGVVSEV